MEGYNQTPEQPMGQQPFKPNNNMPLAIISTIIGICSPCCVGLIVGIVSIVFSTQVDSKYRTGDYAGAETSAKNARLLAFIALGLGVLGLIISIVQIVMMGGIDGFMEQYQQILEEYQ